MEFQISEKPILELGELTHQEIVKGDSIVIVTPYDPEIGLEEIYRNILEQQSSMGIADVSGNMVFKEKIPKDIPTPDYSEWGWTYKMFQDMSPKPLLVFIFERVNEPNNSGSGEKSEHPNDIFLFGDPNVDKNRDALWFMKFQLFKNYPKRESLSRLVDRKEAEKRKDESNAEKEIRFIATLWDAGIRPSSCNAWYIGIMQLTLEAGSDMQNFLQYVPSTQKISKMLDLEVLREETKKQKAFFSSKTIQWLELATCLDPKNFIAWDGLGFIYKKTGMIEMAENCLRQSIRHNPKWVSSYQTDKIFFVIMLRTSKGESPKIVYYV